MIVYPAIDLRDGKCVRLTKGDFNTTKIYHDNPEVILNQFTECGGSWAHIVDLDGAKIGNFTQLEVIKKLVSLSSINLQVGGGIRNTEDIQKLFELGVKRVVVGSICIKDPDLVKTWLNQFGNDKIVLALDCMLNDANIPMVKTHGWQEDSKLSLWDLLESYVDAKYILCTDISVDGMLSGPNINLYKEFKERFPELKLIASGGVSSVNDLISLRNLDIYGVVVGKAIYEGKITIHEALTC